MGKEVRVFAEGSLRWVQASAASGGWLTASAPQSALMGFVQAGLKVNSARNVQTIMDRGLPSHHKIVESTPPDVQFTYLLAVTANMANPATASGASTPQVHLELKVTDTENPALTAQYFQFTNCVLVSRSPSEAVAGDQIQETWRALAYVGPTASGYLA